MALDLMKYRNHHESKVNGFLTVRFSGGAAKDRAMIRVIRVALARLGEQLVRIGLVLMTTRRLETRPKARSG